MAIIGIGICIGENLLLGIGIGSVDIFLYQWNPSKHTIKTKHVARILKHRNVIHCCSSFHNK